MTEHRYLTGDTLHEPKGCDTATVGKVYVSDGAGSGSWVAQNSGVNNLNKFTVNGRFDDVSNPSSIWFVCPQKGDVKKVTAVLYGPITAANSTLTLYKNGTTTGVTLTIAFASSAAGTAFSTTVGSTVSIAEGDVLELRSDGASSTSAALTASITLSATA